MSKNNTGTTLTYSDAPAVVDNSAGGLTHITKEQYAAGLRLPPILKFCMCCKRDGLPHQRRDSARFRIDHVKSEVACIGCTGSGNKKKFNAHRTLEERRAKADESVANTAERKERGALGQLWCSSCQDWHSALLFKLRSRGGPSGNCVGSQTNRHRSGVTSRLLCLVNSGLMARDELRSIAATRNAEYLAKLQPVEQPPLIEPDQPPTPKCVKPVALPSNAATTDSDVTTAVRTSYSDNTTFYSNANEDGTLKQPRKRVSRGALAREEKQRRNAEYDAAVERQQAGIDLRNHPVMTEDEVRAVAKKGLAAAAGRSDGQQRPAYARRQNPSAVVRVSDAEYKMLYDEATKDGQVFYAKPKGWRGTWPFMPSWDRINPANPHYVYGNLRLVPWILNRARGDAAITLVDAWSCQRAAYLDRRQQTIKDLTDADLLREVNRRKLSIQTSMF